MEYRRRTASYDDDQPTPTLQTDPAIDAWVDSLTPDQIARELEQLKARRRDVKHRDADLVAAHSEIIANRVRGTRAEHPIAQERLANGNQPTLMAMARDWAANRVGTKAQAWDDRQVLAYASTAHISEVIAQTATALTLSRAPEMLSIPLKITRPVALPDYKPAATGVLELDAVIDPPSTALREWQAVIPAATAGRLQIAISPLRIRFSEILLVDDNVEAMARTIEAATLASAQNELRMLLALLTGETELPDGEPLFTEANTAADLGAAMAAMRAYPINGYPADATPKYLLVPAAVEAEARAEVASMSDGTKVPVEVLPTAHLAADGPSFLFASPTSWPAVARGTLRGSGGASLRWTPGSPNERESSRDAVLEGLHSIGFEAIGRLGVVMIDDE